jgi:hypothetical protein
MTIAAIGIAILMVAVSGALWLTRGSAPDQPRQVRVLRFMLNFWLLVFVQLVLAAFVFAVWGR